MNYVLDGNKIEQARKETAEMLEALGYDTKLLDKSKIEKAKKETNEMLKALGYKARYAE